jgi:hypothetical protein
MARVSITPFDVSPSPVTEPEPVTLASDGGSVPCGRCVLRLSNPTGAVVDAVVPVGAAAGGIQNLTVPVAAAGTEYVMVADTTLYRQDDGLIYVNGSGLNVLAFTVPE